ncbi:MAG: hypothetical protein Ta2A_10960 [Treponemataceae bacterium]|nr:MAG: hypothetical protein Ta2A_10960 [Treponemataceae bacterium]
MYYRLKNYAKAIPFFKKAALLDPKSDEIIRWLGLACFYKEHYREALVYCGDAIEKTNDDTELLFAMAVSYERNGNAQQALPLYRKLHHDEQYGAESCLASGTIQESSNDINAAIDDYELGLHFMDIPTDILCKLRYQLGSCYLQKKDISQGLAVLQKLQVLSPNYKDVDHLVSYYQELDQTANLQVYMLGSMDNFVALCHRIAERYYSGSKVIFMNSTTHTDSVNFLTDVSSRKRQDVVLFHFNRTTGAIGELFVRDFHNQVRESKAGWGVCICAGSFHDSARKYIEGRPIELIDKPRLISVLKKLSFIPDSD